jgi:hypothetical protein
MSNNKRNYSTMSENKRSGNKWTINELLSLQREYELLEWTIQAIAEKHKRSVIAILYKLYDEGYIEYWEEARGYKHDQVAEVADVADVADVKYIEYIDMTILNSNEDDHCSSEENYCESKFIKLTRHVNNLEKNLNELSEKVNKLIDNSSSNKY